MNTDIYDAVRVCPKEAQRTIQAGRLKGKTDINPMWRIQALTELFGPCGFGWYYTIDRQWLENGAGGEIHAFVNISLYVKMAGEWSKPIQGTGGSYYTDTQKGSLYNSDECYKMALTDAISVACKALGFAADVYWADGATKYSQAPIQRGPTADEANEVMRVIEAIKATASIDELKSLWVSVKNPMIKNHPSVQRAAKEANHRLNP